jgi:pyrroloquinoline-quinone synthase
VVEGGHGFPATLLAVSSSAIATAIDASISGLRLLDHPYYRAWQNGELRQLDLQDYAEQYRHFEGCLPELLSDVAAQMGQGDPRRRVESNLADEMTNPRPHLEMFDDFLKAVGAFDQVSATQATSDLVKLYKDAAKRGPIPFLAVVAAYEVQGAEIAATKATALSLHYDLGQVGTDFWAVHATVERQHSAWTVEALEALNPPSGEVGRWAKRSARAWWEFLDEREEVRAA